MKKVFSDREERKFSKISISKSKKSNSNDSKYNSKWNGLHLHLLTKKDRKQILNFAKAFLKAGRSFVNEEVFEFDPRRIYYQILGNLQNKLKTKFGPLFESYKERFANITMDRWGVDKEKVNEQLKYKEHISALKELYAALNRGNRVEIWKQSRFIVEHFYNTNEKVEGVFKNWSFERLPNITGMDIELEKHHPILKLFGIIKRMGPANLEFFKYKNKEAVKYVAYLERKMHESVGNPHEAELFLYLATNRSVCFKVAAWRKADKLWYKYTTLNDVAKTMKRMHTLDLDNYKFRRQNILKANGKIRPLGVPSMEWRLYLGILNGFLLHWLKPYMFPSQHGFIPDRGTDSAWQEVISKVIPAKYIYEVDFKEYYDRINLDNLRNFLIKTGLSKELVHQIIGWSRTMPQADFVNKSSMAISKSIIDKFKRKSNTLILGKDEDKIFGDVFKGVYSSLKALI